MPREDAKYPERGMCTIFQHFNLGCLTATWLTKGLLIKPKSYECQKFRTIISCVHLRQAILRRDAPHLQFGCG